MSFFHCFFLIASLCPPSFQSSCLFMSLPFSCSPPPLSFLSFVLLLLRFPLSTCLSLPLAHLPLAPPPPSPAVLSLSLSFSLPLSFSPSLCLCHLDGGSWSVDRSELKGIGPAAELTHSHTHTHSLTSTHTH